MTNRFEEKFSVEYYINPLLENYRVPKLFLQPFIENAIIHGFKKMERGGVIKIYGWIQEDNLYFSIEDNGCGMNAEKVRKIPHGDTHSVGIRNVDKRIKLLYGDEYGVQLESRPGVGTTVTIVIPANNNKITPVK